MSTRLYRSLFVPWQLNLLNPSIGFTSLYCGLVYALFYSFFEFFPLVYGDVYDMSIGEVGLVFVSVVIAVLLAFVGYASFTHFVVNKAIKEGRTMAPEPFDPGTICFHPHPRGALCVCLDVAPEHPLDRPRDW